MRRSGFTRGAELMGLGSSATASRVTRKVEPAASFSTCGSTLSDSGDPSSVAKIWLYIRNSRLILPMKRQGRNSAAREEAAQVRRAESEHEGQALVGGPHGGRGAGFERRDQWRDGDPAGAAEAFDPYLALDADEVAAGGLRAWDEGTKAHGACFEGCGEVETG